MNIWLHSKCHPDRETCSLLSPDGMLTVACSECHETIVRFCLCCNDEKLQRIFEEAEDGTEDGLVA